MCVGVRACECMSVNACECLCAFGRVHVTVFVHTRKGASVHESLKVYVFMYV